MMEENLDAILEVLLCHKMEKSETDFFNSGVMIKEICELLKINIDKGEDKLYSATLLNDGYIEKTNPITDILIRISHKGINFYLKGGYINEEKERIRKEEIENLQIQLVKSSISINKWSKQGIIFTLIISLFSLIVSIIAIIHSK